MYNGDSMMQTVGLEMIASENFTSLAVLDCMSSCANNKELA